MDQTSATDLQYYMNLLQDKYKNVEKEDLVQINSLLQKELKREKKRPDKDPEMNEFISNFMLELITQLSTGLKAYDTHHLEIIQETFELEADILLARLNNRRLKRKDGEALALFFDYRSNLFDRNCQISEARLKKIILKEQPWRKWFEVGQLVDCQPAALKRYSLWTQALIQDVKYNETIVVSYIYENSVLCEQFPKSSLSLAPFGTKTQASFDWRKTLSEGQQVDAYDSQNFVKATILELQSQNGVPAAKVAFRIYHAKGIAKDGYGQYDGYSPYYDEWIPLYSPRIQPYHTVSTQFGEDLKENNLMDDFDPYFQKCSGFKETYLVPKLGVCQSHLYLNVTNYFGNKGGFDLIKDYLDYFLHNAKDLDDMYICTMLVKSLSQPILTYTRSFLQSYFPQILIQCHSLLHKYSLLLCQQDNPSHCFTHNPSSPFVEAMVEMQRRFLEKVPRVRKELTMNLDLALVQFKEEDYDEKVKGVEKIKNLIVQSIKQEYVFTIKILPEWLRLNDLLPRLFDYEQTSGELLERSSWFLALLSKDDYLSPDNFALLLQLIDTDLKLSAFKLLNDMAYTLRPSHYRSIVDKVFSLDGPTFQDMKFVVELLCSQPSYEEQVYMQQRLWDFLLLSDPLEMSRKLNHIYFAMTLIYDYNLSVRLLYAEEKKVKQFMEEFVPVPFEKEQEDLYVALRQLRAYCNYVNEKAEDMENFDIFQPQAMAEEKQDGGYSEEEQISTRMNFIKHLLEINERTKLNDEELMFLHDELVEKSRVPEAQEWFWDWLEEFDDSEAMKETIKSKLALRAEQE